ncbi:hypothetical protein BgiBS90_022560 [Biomphalaria glabrata]|nr:hypothetical protein BgiBS90_022560 [Biomphalaria glabrata]
MQCCIDALAATNRLCKRMDAVLHWCSDSYQPSLQTNGCSAALMLWQLPTIFANEWVQCCIGALAATNHLCKRMGAVLHWRSDSYQPSLQTNGCSAALVL